MPRYPFYHHFNSWAWSLVAWWLGCLNSPTDTKVSSCWPQANIWRKPRFALILFHLARSTASNIAEDRLGEISGEVDC